LQWYIRWVFKVWRIATCGYLIICYLFAVIAVSAPSSRLNEILAHATECAHRLSINNCENKKLVASSLQRECFALAMCVSQPKYLIIGHEIFLECGRQLWSSLYWFIALVSLYILITAAFPEEVVAGAPGGPSPPGTPQPRAPSPRHNDLPDVVPGASRAPGRRQLHSPDQQHPLFRGDLNIIPPNLRAGPRIARAPSPGLGQAAATSDQHLRGHHFGVRLSAGLSENHVPALNVNNQRSSSEGSPASSEAPSLGAILRGGSEHDFVERLPLLSDGASFVRLLLRHRLTIHSWDMSRGLEYAHPRGSLIPGDGEPLNHLVDERGARFRIRDSQDNFLPLVEVLRILRNPPPAAQPPLLPNRPNREVQEELIFVLESHREFFRTENIARDHILVQHNLFPIPTNTFSAIGQPLPIYLPASRLRPAPVLGPHVMLDVDEYGDERPFIVFDQEGDPVNPALVADILRIDQIREQLSRQDQHGRNNFIRESHLVPVVYLHTADGVLERGEVLMPQGNLVAQDQFIMLDEAGIRFLVYRHGNYTIPLDNNEVMRLQTEFLQRAAQPQLNVAYTGDPEGRLAAVDVNGAVGVQTTPRQTSLEANAGDGGQEVPAPQNNEN
jgi:hypothetical protein